METTTVREGNRTALKREMIIEAATEVFLAKGYLGTSMDEIAARAAVSKQTVYKQFVDKETLFVDVIRGVMGRVDEEIQAAAEALGHTDDPAAGLGLLAQRFLESVRRPQVLQLRRLVIGEAGRFPELGRTYWERAFETGLTTLSAGLRRLADRGLLRVDDADAAAQHFAALVLWIPMNRAMFCGPGEHLSDARLGETADTGVQAFLRAYSPTASG